MGFKSMQVSKKTSFWLGLIIFLGMFTFTRPETIPNEPWAVLSVVLLMVIWWLCETIPIYVTALLPLILIPLVTSQNFQEVALPYANQSIFLFLGGFILAIAIETSGLHKRFAFFIIRNFGATKKSILISFMIVSYLISMWIINTATALMLLPLAIQVCKQINEKKSSFELYLLLAIAYSATIGGMATIVGTAPNILFVGFMLENYNIDISFYDWLKIGFPLSLVILFFTYIVFRMFLKNEKLDCKLSPSNLQLNKPIKMLSDEKKVLFIFLCTILAWFFRGFLNQYSLFEDLTDAGIAITAAFLFFLIPSSNQKKDLLQWKQMKDIPWGLMLLFGGGLAIAKAIMTSGLGDWIASQLFFLEQFSNFWIIFILVLVVILFTEILSNTALTIAMLPIASIIAFKAELPIKDVCTVVVIASSCAFMLPVATPPNAVVFATGRLKIYQMAKAGIFLNIFALVFLSLFFDLFVIS
jgi:sodium-dependent dicarboxylate transporter 2/3/5